MPVTLALVLRWEGFMPAAMAAIRSTGSTPRAGAAVVDLRAAAAVILTRREHFVGLGGVGIFRMALRGLVQ